MTGSVDLTCTSSILIEEKRVQNSYNFRWNDDYSDRDLTSHLKGCEYARNDRYDAEAGIFTGKNCQMLMQEV